MQFLPYSSFKKLDLLILFAMFFTKAINNFIFGCIQKNLRHYTKINEAMIRSIATIRVRRKSMFYIIIDLRTLGSITRGHQS